MEKSKIKKFAEKSNAWPFVEARNLRDRLDKIENSANKNNNIPVFEKNFSLVDVYSSQESFITGTLGSLTQVLTIDGRNIGSSDDGWPVTEKLRSSYKELINA